MEHPGDKRVPRDPCGAGSDFHGDKEEQTALGSHLQPDEGKGFPSKCRTVQVQVEKPRYPL